MFYHAYDSYMTHAFPLDNLKPITCQGESFELGKIPMLTLIDTLDTLVVFGDKDEFRRAVALVTTHATFDLDTEVSVFETTIRVLGGLLSAHLFAVDPTLQLYSNTSEPAYSGGLLALAADLGDRLLPAFVTPTGIPFGTVNLRRGVPKGETSVASTAGAGSLSIEFTMLSILTKNPIYAQAARQAVRGLFFRRSALGLVGKHIDTATGEWTETSSGPGSNSDSFYEYLLKMYVLYGDSEALDMFEPVYSAVMEHNKHGDWYTDVSMWDGCLSNQHHQSFIFDNLVAFWPGMQSLLGDFASSTRSLNAFYQVWQQYSFLPEQFDVGRWRPKKQTRNGYPLRPELLESTYYVHVATNDSSWLTAGALAVQSLERYAKTTCGYAAISDVETRTVEDTMPSYFLSETCKYLYLLFDETNFLRKANYVFTTEAHPFPVLPSADVTPILRASDETKYGVPRTATHWNKYLTCPVIQFWDDVGFRRAFHDRFQMARPRCTSSSSTKPKAKKKKTPEDEKIVTKSLYGGKTLGYFHVEQLLGGFRVTRRSDRGQWLKVTNLGDPHIIVESHSSSEGGGGSTTTSTATTTSSSLTEFRVFEFASQTMRRCRLQVLGRWVSCSAAEFGLTKDPSVAVSIQNAPVLYGTPHLGCTPLESTPHRVVVLHRGECFFDEKANRATQAGAVAAVIVNSEPNPSAAQEEEENSLMVMGPSKEATDQQQKIDIPVVMVPFAADAMIREAVANGDTISLEVGVVTELEYPRAAGSRFDVAVAGPDGGGVHLVAKMQPEGTPLWTISITEHDARELDVDDKEVEELEEPRNPGTPNPRQKVKNYKVDVDKVDVDEYATKLKGLGFSDQQLARMNSDDPDDRLDALVDGLRALGLHDLVAKFVGRSKDIGVGEDSKNPETPADLASELDAPVSFDQPDEGHDVAHSTRDDADDVIDHDDTCAAV
ncbi:hypothetical protein DYB37_001309 [Aphanomyces astaci]|uniref:alpha-1,2-Mannosidase n=1 Tax=Aphanomyces astaci TaxID=112090 RepID=A0A3R7CE18_APHAT|nr:hypothetical protein DYB37_001309 [Aphanomyces astaci]